MSSSRRALRELSRKVTVFEVNEAVMSRKYASVKEQLQVGAAAVAKAPRNKLSRAARACAGGGVGDKGVLCSLILTTKP